MTKKEVIAAEMLERLGWLPESSVKEEAIRALKEELDKGILEKISGHCFGIKTSVKILSLLPTLAVVDVFPVNNDGVSPIKTVGILVKYYFNNVQNQRF